MDVRKLLLIGIGCGILLLIAIVVILVIALVKTNKKNKVPEFREPFHDLVIFPPIQAEDGPTISPEVTDDISHYQIQTPDGSDIHIGKIHAVGRRKNQQDSFSCSNVQNMEQILEKGILLLVADGMGGLSNGAEVSGIVAKEMQNFFETHDFSSDIPQKMLEMLLYANDKVNEFLGPEGLGESGSTLVAAHVKDHKLHWISVGDSRLYLYRRGELTLLNEIHNYGMQLGKQVAAGEITREEALAKKNKSALTSYIGAGRIALIDQNKEPLCLEPKDRLILMSDGIETVSEAEISQKMCYEVEEAALKIRYLIEEKNKRNQDNFTAIILEDDYKE